MKTIKPLSLLLLLAATFNMFAMDNKDKDRSNQLATISKKRTLEFTCNLCTYVCEDEHALASHQKETHNARIPAYHLEKLMEQKEHPLLRCEFCGIDTFKYDGLLKLHIRNDHHRCTICLEEVTDSYLHTKEKHPETITKIKCDSEG